MSKAREASPPNLKKLRKKLQKAGQMAKRFDSDDEYITVKDGEALYTTMPVVRLSFEDNVESTMFTSKAILSDRFSDIFHVLYEQGMKTIATTFVAQGKGWYGMRVVPIKFARKEPCVAAEAPIDRPPLAFLRHLPEYVQVFSPRTRAVRRAETMAMNAVTSWPLPRSTRDVVLLHWVTDEPKFWAGVRKSDVVHATQWLDTHSHPAWFYKHAAKHKGRMVLLLIDAPEKTQMLRVDRHSLPAHRTNLLKSGQWSHYVRNSNECEVRLPPGTYEVRDDPPTVVYADMPVLVVYLRYKAYEHKVCDDLPLWKRMRMGSA
jgi:hypothetical protein